MRDSLRDVPAFIRAPLDVLVPNFGILWSGDLFYADVLTLPWAYVGTGCLYLLVWSAGALLLALGAALSVPSGGIRGACHR